MPVLDTTFLIDLGRSKRNANHQAAKARLAEIVGDHRIPCTTRLNIAELWSGIESAPDRVLAVRRFKTAIRGVSILDFDAAATRRFGNLDAHLRKVGRPAGELDTLIASICLANGQNIITRNPKHFADVPGLVVETY